MFEFGFQKCDQERERQALLMNQNISCCAAYNLNDQGESLRLASTTKASLFSSHDG